jgi:hypothetical protein
MTADPIVPIIVSWLNPIKASLPWPLWIDDPKFLPIFEKAVSEVDDVIDAMRYYERIPPPGALPDMLGRIEAKLETIAAAVGKDRSQVRGESR